MVLAIRPVVVLLFAVVVLLFAMVLLLFAVVLLLFAVAVMMMIGLLLLLFLFASRVVGCRRHRPRRSLRLLLSPICLPVVGL